MENPAREAKVTLLVIIGSDNLHCELGTFCYIITDVFGYTCSYVRYLKGVVEWAASKISAFKRAVSTSQQVTSLFINVSRLLS